MRYGFSLVELSIVLVILGLLTGGILSGQNLIRAAELRSVNTQISQYYTASMTFRDKYFYYPGDVPNAVQFWGAPGNNVSNCPSTAGTGSQTCNGNGDGRLTAAAAANQYGEPFTFWQHLANAGLIEGRYTGISGPSAAYHAVRGENSPNSKLGNSGVFYADYILTQSGSGLQFQGSYGFVFGLGRDKDTTNFNGDSPVISNEEAWNIDTKMDDGKPGTGRVRAYKNTSRPRCASSDDPATAIYQLTSSTSADCNLLFIVGH